MNEHRMTEVAHNLTAPIQSRRKYNQKNNVKQPRCKCQVENLRVQGRVREPRV